MDFTNLRKYQDMLSESRIIPGSTCIAYVGGKEVYRHSAGFADVESGRKMKGDELFFMYSISKVVTSLAALQLLERGLFHLNDRLDFYMPEFGSMKVKVSHPDGSETVEDSKVPMRVRDIFCMTAGYDYNMESEQIKKWREENGRITTADMAKILAGTPLCFEPGNMWCYGLSHEILAAFVEKLSGQRFDEYVKEHIFDPVGMKDSCYHMPKEEMERRMASQYSFSDEKGIFEKINLSNWSVLGEDYDSGGAGVISSADDMARLAKVLAAGGVTDSGERIISKMTIDLWRTNRLDEKQLKSYSWDGLCGYGYGLGVRTHIDRALSGSVSSLGEFGWSGAAGGFIMIDPDMDCALFHVYHMLNNQEGFVIPRMRNIFYTCLDR